MTDQHPDPNSQALSAEDEEALARLTRAPRQAVPEADIALVAILLDEIEAGRMRIDFDRRVIAHPHSPISVSALETQFAITAVVIVIAVMIFLGWKIGLGIGALVVAFYWFFFRGWLNRRMSNSALRAFRENVETWRKTWAFGGVKLTPAGGATCVAPQDSWRQLAQSIAAK